MLCTYTNREHLRRSRVRRLHARVSYAVRDDDVGLCSRVHVHTFHRHTLLENVAVQAFGPIRATECGVYELFA